MSNITTCLWFDGRAEEAANFYVKTFAEGGRKANIGKIARYGESGAKVSGQPKDSAMTVEFELDGNGFLGLNGGPLFKFSPATSFVIHCKTQEEIDYFWAKLAEGGKEGQCGWIDYDKFGVSWQVVPTMLGELMSDPDPEKSERAMKAMLAMKKLDIAALKEASGKK
jgi:predicted 3-demethylubiquinone-9 3-methyltransferase (glyoxalase superfamily)